MRCSTTRHLVLLALAFALAVPAAQASILNPGQTAPPDILTAPSGTALGSISGTISPGTFSTTYTEWVYADPNNTFCSGCLDFVYQFTDNGPGINERYTGYSFAGFLVDVGYDPSTGTLAPSTVDRSTNGAVVGFNYIGTDEIVSGQTTPLLIIETNATLFVPGLVSAQDGSAGTGAGFSPAVPTPEPATLSLFASGLLLAGGFLRRRR